MAAGETLTWLGYEVRLVDGEPQVTIGANAWSSLDKLLDNAHKNFLAEGSVADAVTSWISWLGPTFGSYRSAERRAILDRVLAIASDQGFEIEKPASTLMEV